MAHLTVYLPDDIEERARALAKANGASVNKWIASQISAAVRRSWSPEFLAAGGADPDFPEVETLEYGTDSGREAID
jgi:predicted transcriptional regulator